ncbi:hypothetical protein JHK82_050160 [Glycine max]|nr:hypothetical protein JHK82_050160 [Glycine max]
MEHFNKAKAMKLRSHLGKYLVADDDKLCQSKQDGFHMKLRSWCGKYLRGNSGMASWRNSVTHNWILCDLEPVHEFPVKIVSFTESKFSSLDSEDELPSSEGESLRSQNSQVSVYV